MWVAFPRCWFCGRDGVPSFEPKLNSAHHNSSANIWSDRWAFGSGPVVLD